MPNTMNKHTLIDWSNSHNSKLIEEWDYEQNGELTPEMFAPGCTKRVWWKCPLCQQSYQASINHRTHGTGCPFCSGRRIVVGYNDLASQKPELAQEWDNKKNGDITPEKVTLGSAKRIWWICPTCNGHYQATVYNRTHGTGCPYCSGQRVLYGYNDLQTTEPELCNEWDYEFNGETKPCSVTTHSGKKVWWICSTCHGHYQARIYSRVKGSNCPYCSGQRVLVGYNDLSSKHPELCKEWNYNRNGDITPEKVTLGSSKRVWWICSICGNEWRTSITKRVEGTGCPNCGTRQTSFSEQAVFYYVKKYFPDAKNRDKSNSFEVDIYIPSINTAIEYDGFFFHNKKRGMQDDEKDNLCFEKGIRLIRIREKDLPATENAENIIRKTDSNESLNKSISDLLIALGIESFRKPDVESDSLRIHAQYTEQYKENSLANKGPSLLSEWNYEKNGKLKPEQVTLGSDKKVWWKCPNCDNEWKATIYNRTKGSGCPVCSARKASQRKKYNQQSFKECIHETSPDVEILGEYIDTSTKLLCRCKKCGHKWTPWPSNLLKGTGCPKCRAIERGRAQAKTTEQFKEELKKRNSSLQLLGEYSNNATKVEVVCKLCGNHFFKTPSQLLNNPKCTYCGKKI